MGIPLVPIEVTLLTNDFSQAPQFEAIQLHDLFLDDELLVPRPGGPLGRRHLRPGHHPAVIVHARVALPALKI